MKKNNKIFSLVIFAAISLFFVTTSMAQTTGEIAGVVSDANGAGVPNATVTLSGANLIVAKTATTGGDGGYRFSQIPPGKYTVAVPATAGFGAYATNDVVVNLSTTTTVNVELKAAGVGGVVDVVATPDIDQTNNTTGSNISTDQFSNFPTSRTVQGLYTIAPTVTRSGLRDASGRDRDPSVGGSSGPENNYILDGVNTSDPAFGGWRTFRLNLCRKSRSRPVLTVLNTANPLVVSLTSLQRAAATNSTVTYLDITRERALCET